MGVKITGRMIDPLTYEMRHESGALIMTTAPKDNGGGGDKFSPTDLAVTAYGSCVATIVGLYAEHHDITIDELSFELEKEMSTNPRRIGKIIATFKVKTNCTKEAFDKLIKAGQGCPVRRSLHSETVVEEKFVQIK